MYLKYHYKRLKSFRVLVPRALASKFSTRDTHLDGRLRRGCRLSHQRFQNELLSSQSWSSGTKSTLMVGGRMAGATLPSYAWPGTSRRAERCGWDDPISESVKYVMDMVNRQYKLFVEHSCMSNNDKNVKNEMFSLLIGFDFCLRGIRTLPEHYPAIFKPLQASENLRIRESKVPMGFLNHFTDIGKTFVQFRTQNLIEYCCSIGFSFARHNIHTNWKLMETLIVTLPELGTNGAWQHCKTKSFSPSTRPHN